MMVLPMHTAPSTNAPAEAPWQRWRRTGDGDAFAALVQRHGPMVAAVCRRRLGDGADADDAFQAVFLLLLRRGHGIRDPERVGPWLHTCAVRACAQVRRTARRRARHEGAVPPPTPAEPSTDWSAVRGHLDDAIAGLTAAQRSAVVGFYLEGRAQADLAAAAGCSVAAVKMRLQAGLAALRQALARRGVGLPAPALVAGLAQERSALAGHPPGVDPGAVAPGRIAEAIIAADRLRWAAGIAAAVAGCGLAGGAWLWAAGSSVAPPRSPVPSPAPAVAADPPPPAPRAEDPWLRPDRQAVAAIGATADLRTLGLTARPFTLAADPEAAPALGRMWGELRRWNDLYRRRGGEDGVPFMALVESAQGLTAQALAPAPGQRQQPMLLTIAPGSALADLAAYRWEAATDTVVAGHRGWEQGAFTAIATDRHWLLGERSAVTAALGRAHDRQPAPPDAPLWIRYRQPDAAPDSPPAVLLTSRPEPDGIRSRMVLADTAPAPRIDGVALGAWSLRTWQDLPWRAPRPGRLRAAGDHDAVLAAGLDLTAPRAERIAAAVAGILGRPLTELLDGDVLVEADWPAG
ncbi:MAG: polymerase sigma factor SigE, partial [Planctomycetota bacterium]